MTLSGTALGILLMLLATSMNNVGAVVQKKAVDRLPPFEGRGVYQSVRSILHAPLWLLGLGLVATATVLNMVAVGMADLNVIQPLNGFGLVVLAICSRWLLGERLTGWSLAGSLLVVAGVVAVGLVAAESRIWSTPAELWGSYLGGPALLTLGSLFSFVLLCGVGARGWWRRAAGPLYALAAAGCSVLGLTWAKGFFGTLGLLGLGATLRQGPPWLLLAGLLCCSTLALALQQLSFQRGRAVIVTPIFASTSVVLPLFVGWGVFREPLAWAGLVGPLLIVVGVAVLASRPGEPRREG